MPRPIRGHVRFHNTHREYQRMKMRQKYLTSVFFVLITTLIACSAIAEGQQPPPRLEAPVPDAAYAYQLYPTTNIWTHILLDTATGRAWQVQFSVGDDAPSAKFEINNESLLPTGSAPKSGRFTIYPTQNMYTFLILDRKDSRMWQLQWST